MAEAVVAVVTVLADQLVSIGRQRIEKEVNLLVGVEDEVKSLTRTLNFIRASLNDAEKRQATEQLIKVWLESLKETMYDAEDVLEEWFTRISMSQSENQGVVTDDGSSSSGKVRSYLSSLCSCFQSVSVLHKHEIASAIERIREDLDVIARDKDQFKLVENDSRHQEYSSPRITSSIVDESEICGRDLDKEALLGRLVGECSTQQAHIPIIAIVGMGGSGKTTLAQLLYSEIKSNFEICMWVCVSDPFELHKVTKEIIEQTPGGKGQNFIGWESLHQCLSETVKGKKYLLVLDDVWSKDRKVWDPLKFSLNGGAQGSRIIITTRNEGVAKMMRSDIHNLGMLSEEDSWLLFWRIVSLGRTQEELRKLEEIGKEIVRKCKGLPLAVKTIASLMQSQRNEHDWKSVLASDIWDVQLVEENILPALWLSYYALPTELKQCFIYCAVFPKDTVLYKTDLVKHWMAQGFLGYDGSKELETVGANYFEDLVARSFFQDIQREDDDSNVKCKMHDLVHDLALFLSGKKFRHIGKRENVDEFPSESKNLRSLRIKPDKQAFLKLCSELRHLRLLDLSDSDIAEVPNEVGSLLHLRYLDLSDNGELKELPETMCELYHLQTLKLNGCESLCKLPEGIGKLSNLRHIEVEYTDNLKAYPRGIGRLHQLRELCKFPLSAASEGCCGLEELGNLNHLEGKLKIKGLGNVKSVDEVKRAEIRKKKKLIRLKLEFGDGDGDGDEDEAILEGLQPAESLKDLRIKDFSGVAFPFWMCGSLLSNLVKLHLENCKNCIELPALGSPRLSSLKLIDCPKLMRVAGLEGFEHLCELNIIRCPKLRAPTEGLGKLESLEELFLEDVGIDVFAVGGNGESSSSSSVVLFPKLRELTLWNLPEWEEISIINSTNSIIMPNLQELRIRECGKLKAVPHYMFSPSLKSLDLQDCPQLTDMGMQPNKLPLQLEELQLWGDVGIYSRSLSSVLIINTDNNPSSNYSNLKTVRIVRSSHARLPLGLNTFTSLQTLGINFCEFLDLKPEEELRHFPMLKYLEIFQSPVLEERCEREDWKSTSFPYTIEISFPYTIRMKGSIQFGFNHSLENSGLPAIQFFPGCPYWHQISWQKLLCLNYSYHDNYWMKFDKASRKFFQYFNMHPVFSFRNVHPIPNKQK